MGADGQEYLPRRLLDLARNWWARRTWLSWLRLEWLAAGGLSLVAFAFAFFSPVSNTNSDPRQGLLVSQAILEHGTVRLDPYAELIADQYSENLGRIFLQVDGRLYYYFPLGTPIFASPFVAVARWLGWDMRQAADEQALQNFISAVLVGLVTLLIFHLCRQFSPPPVSLAITGVSVFGSALISTLGTALWSIDFAVFFVCLGLILWVRLQRGHGGNATAVLLGACLFGAYLCRPSTAVFIALALGFLALANRRAFWLAALPAGSLLLLFLLFTRLEYGQWLPFYYGDIGRLQIERQPLPTAMYGLLFSPSRGLLIFSPFLLVTLAVSGWLLVRRPRKLLLWFSLLWFCLQLFLVARSTEWWGGYAYGPRLLAGVLPALILLTLLAWQEARKAAGRRTRIFLGSAYLLLGLAAVFINSYQGLFNHYTSWWNGAIPPDVNREPAVLFDWRYPQFLASNESLCKRSLAYAQEALAEPALSQVMHPYRLGERLSLSNVKQANIHDLTLAAQRFRGPPARTAGERSGEHMYLPTVLLTAPADLLFFGWAPQENDFRWSMCRQVRLAFHLEGDVATNGWYALRLQAGSFGEQRVSLVLNGREVGQMSFTGGPNSTTAAVLTLPGSLLQPGEVNVIDLILPDAQVPSSKDPRLLGLAFVSLSISLQP